MDGQERAFHRVIEAWRRECGRACGEGEGLWDYIDENDKLIKWETSVTEDGNLWRRNEKEVECD